MADGQQLPVVAIDGGGHGDHSGAGEIVLLLIALAIGALALSGGLDNMWNALLAYLRGGGASSSGSGGSGGSGGGTPLPLPIPAKGQGTDTIDTTGTAETPVPDNVIPFPGPGEVAVPAG